MENSFGKETPNFADDIYLIRIMSFASYRKALLYAGIKQDEYNNWTLAKAFAKVHKMIPIDKTEGGNYLNIPDREKDLNYTFKQFQRLWHRASIRYCLNIEGTVKTLVCGARRESTFRRKEIPAMLRSKTIESINGHDHAEYVRLRRVVLARLKENDSLPDHSRHSLSINAVFRKMALAEIRQDLAIAREQNNSQEEQSVLARVGHLRWRHKEELKAVPRSREQEKRSEAVSAQEEMARANPTLPMAMLGGRHLGF